MVNSFKAKYAKFLNLGLNRFQDFSDLFYKFIKAFFYMFLYGK